MPCNAESGLGFGLCRFVERVVGTAANCSWDRGCQMRLSPANLRGARWAKFVEFLRGQRLFERLNADGHVWQESAAAIWDFG